MRAPEPPAFDALAAVLQAIQTEHQTLGAHPSDFASIVVNRLAADGADWEDLERSLRLGSKPLLRRRAALQVTPDPTSAVTGHDLTACAVRWDQIVAGTADGRLCIWKRPSAALGDPDATLFAHAGRVSFLGLAAGNELLLSGGDDGVAHVWSAVLEDSDSPRETYDDHAGPITSMLYPAGRGMLATGGDDGVIRVWRQGHADPVRRLIAHGGTITSLAVSPDGRLLISASRDATLRVWDLATGSVPATVRGHGAAVIACAVVDDPSGSSAPRILSASADGLVKLWTITGDPYLTLGAHQGAIRDMRYVPPPEGPYAVTAGDDCTISGCGTCGPCASRASSTGMARPSSRRRRMAVRRAGSFRYRRIASAGSTISRRAACCARSARAVEAIRAWRSPRPAIWPRVSPPMAR